VLGFTEPGCMIKMYNPFSKNSRCRKLISYLSVTRLVSLMPVFESWILKHLEVSTPDMSPSISGNIYIMSKVMSRFFEYPGGETRAPNKSNYLLINSSNHLNSRQVLVAFQGKVWIKTRPWTSYWPSETGDRI
jgi:hypothetical protein